MSHIAAAPPCARGFARSLREAPLQRFHSIIIGSAVTPSSANDGSRVLLQLQAPTPQIRHNARMPPELSPPESPSVLAAEYKVELQSSELKKELRLIDLVG